MRTLYIFDFDDTLVDSESEVRVVNAAGDEKSMTSGEYAKYKAKPGDKFDFSDFDAYPKKAEIIEPVFAELRSAIASEGAGSVVILTARSNPDPVNLFLKAHDVPSIQVVAVGSADPMEKARYVLDRVKRDDYDEVVVFEDNVKNIRKIRKTLSKEGVRLTSNRVSNGRIIDVVSEAHLKRIMRLR